MFTVKLIVLSLTGIYIIYKDIKERIITNQINLFLLVFGLVVTIFDFEHTLSHLLGFVIVGGFLLLLAILTKGFGMGDVKYMFTIGLILGAYQGIIALVIGFLLGGLYSGTMLMLKKVKKTDYIAYGPFLVIGSIIGLVYPYL